MRNKQFEHGEFLRARTGRPRQLDNLTMDAMAAQRAGMSYGKYKALHPETEEKNDALRKDMVEEARKHRAEKGKTAENKAGKPARRIYRKTCPVCGTVFDTHLIARKFCCDTCKNKVNTARYRARWAKEKEARNERRH